MAPECVHSQKSCEHNELIEQHGNNDHVAAGTVPAQDARPCQITLEELTKRPQTWWPSEAEQKAPQKKLYSVKEVTNMYGISSWLIYHHIKTDPSFPVVNVGIKKKFLIDLVKFEIWLEEKTARFKQTEHNMIGSAELLRFK